MSKPINAEFVALYANYLSDKDSLQVLVQGDPMTSGMSPEQIEVIMFKIAQCDKAMSDLEIYLKDIYGANTVFDWINYTMTIDPGLEV